MILKFIANSKFQVEVEVKVEKALESEPQP